MVSQKIIKSFNSENIIFKGDKKMAKWTLHATKYSYIFDGKGGMRDQLEQAILTELEAKQYPLARQIKEVKAGLVPFLKSKEQCVVIALDKESEIIISNTTVGTYLYVGIYCQIWEKTGFFSNLTDNLFKRQAQEAVIAAAKETIESSFVKLDLRQSNLGYQPSIETSTSVLE